MYRYLCVAGSRTLHTLHRHVIQKVTPDRGPCIIDGIEMMYPKQTYSTFHWIQIRVSKLGLEIGILR
jgi:hypothetical protein